MKYEEIYKVVLESGNVEVENRLNEVLYDMLLAMPDPELWEVLRELNPTSNLKIVFLDWDRDIDSEFSSPSEMVEILRNAPYDLDFNKYFLISFDGQWQTVDAVSELALGWDDVFEQALDDGLIWDCVPNDGASEDLEFRFKKAFGEAESLCTL